MADAPGASASAVAPTTLESALYHTLSGISMGQLDRLDSLASGDLAPWLADDRGSGTLGTQGTFQGMQGIPISFGDASSGLAAGSGGAGRGEAVHRAVALPLIDGMLDGRQPVLQSMYSLPLAAVMDGRGLLSEMMSDGCDFSFGGGSAYESQRRSVGLQRAGVRAPQLPPPPRRHIRQTNYGSVGGGGGGASSPRGLRIAQGGVSKLGLGTQAGSSEALALPRRRVALRDAYSAAALRVRLKRDPFGDADGGSADSAEPDAGLQCSSRGRRIRPTEKLEGGAEWDDEMPCADDEREQEGISAGRRGSGTGGTRHEAAAGGIAVRADCLTAFCKMVSPPAPPPPARISWPQLQAVRHICFAGLVSSYDRPVMKSLPILACSASIVFWLLISLRGQR